MPPAGLNKPIHLHRIIQKTVYPFWGGPVVERDTSENQPEYCPSKCLPIEVGLPWTVRTSLFAPSTCRREPGS